MKILAISTSSNVCSVALVDNYQLINELNICDEKTHSEKLMPLIDQLLSSAKISLADIGLIACDIGPGSFTGIRIGVSTAKAIAEAKNIPVVGCSSLEGLAYNACNFEYVCPLIDAKNNQVYSAFFDKDYNLLSEYYADDINNLTSIMRNYNNLTFVGDGVKLLNISSDFDNNIHSGNIGICAYKKFLKGLATNADNLNVLYLRKSQAERMRNA